MKYISSLMRSERRWQFTETVLIIINDFFMCRIPLWLYTCETQSAMHETLQQYTIWFNWIMYYIFHCIPHSPPRPHTIACGSYPYYSLSKLGVSSRRPLSIQVKGTWKNQTNKTNPWTKFSRLRYNANGKRSTVRILFCMHLIKIIANKI